MFRSSRSRSTDKDSHSYSAIVNSGSEELKVFSTYCSIAEKLSANRYVVGASQPNTVPTKPCLTRQRSFKRAKHSEDGGKLTGDKQPLKYELSSDIQNKQIEMLERKYGGGAIKTQQAAEIIQYNFRQYTLSKNFERLRNTRDDMRVQRIMSDISSEKDSVWSDVTITSAATTPPPMPLLDIDHIGIYSRSVCSDDSAIMSTPSPGSAGNNSDSRLSPDISYLSNKATVGSSGYPHRSHSQSSSHSREIAHRLHLVQPSRPAGSALKDGNDNVTNSAKMAVDGNLVSVAYSGTANSLGELNCSCQSSDSGDTGSIGSNGDLTGYSRNQSASNSRLTNVRVQFNKCSDRERKRQYRIGLNLFNK